MPQLALVLFGPLQVSRDGVLVTAFHSDKARALLAFLAIESDRPHRRETLAGLLWPGYTEASARQSLSQALLSINRMLPAPATDALPLISATRGELQLNSVAITVDALQFAALIRTFESHRHAPGTLCPACAEGLCEALALYRGDVLDGFSLRDSPAFEEWLLLQRERHHRLAVVASQALAQAQAQDPRPDETLVYARRWAELEPLDEYAHREVMRLLAETGQRSLALAQYESLRRTLRAELGVEPEDATRVLAERIRSGTVGPVATGLVAETAEAATHGGRPAQAAGPHSLPAEGGRTESWPGSRHNLPAAVDSFVGRERELREVAALLSAPGVRLVTLVGTGGMGKTRLALEVSRAALAGFPDGAWFVDLTGLPAAPTSPDARADGHSTAVCQAIALTLGLVQAEDERALVLALQERHMLLVLDNCEHVLGSAAPAAEHLLRGCPQVTLLATSREPLRLAGEHLYEVPPLGLPAEGDGDLNAAGALGYEAIRLLADRAAAARFGACIDEDNVQAAVAVCRHLDGMPLAIELAAARLSALSLEELAARLEQTEGGAAADAQGVAGQRWALLSAGSRASHRRQQTLLNTVSWSYGLLEPLEQHLFDRLSIFAGSFTLEGACALCIEGDIIDPARVPGLLAGLVDRSLVQRLPPGAGAQRYRLLEMLRAYGRERLEERGESDAVEAAFIAFYVRLTGEAEPNLRTNDLVIVATMRRLDEEDANLKAAVRRALDRGDPESALRIAAATEWWLMYHGRLQDYVGDVREALQHEDRLPPALRSRAWDVVGLYDLNWNRLDEWEAVSRQQLEAALEAEDDSLVGWAYERQAMLASFLGHGQRAEALRRQALELGRAAGDRALTNMTELLLTYSLPADEQLAAIERLLPETPRPPNAYAFQQAAFIAWSTGELARAEHYLRITVDCWRGLGNRPMTGSMSCNLAALCLQRGASEGEVLDLHAQGEDLLGNTGHLRAYLERVGTRGQLLLWLGRVAEAESCLSSAVDRALQLDEPDYHYDDRLRLALARAERGEIEGARVALSAAEAVAVHRDEAREAALLDTRGRVALLAGDAQGAIAPLREHLALAQSEQGPVHIAQAREHLAWALAEAGNWRRPQPCCLRHSASARPPACACSR